MDVKKKLLMLAGVLVTLNGVGLAMLILKNWVVDTPVVRAIGGAAYLGGAASALALVFMVRKMMKEVESQDEHED